jgi:nucleotide-binding universal stress UspA family protein
MKKILLPVDFSPISVSAATHAAALACRFEAELTVLHVAPGHAPYAGANDLCLPPAYALEVAWNETRRRDAKDAMAEFVSNHLRGIPVTPCVLAGDAAKLIVEHAHLQATDLIVMGTHGFGGFRRMLLGSITAKVLHDAECPVFTSTHVESTSATLRPLRTIVCAIDYGSHSEAVLRWADEFACCVGAQLLMSHVLPTIPTGEWGYCDRDISVAMQKDTDDKAHALLESTRVRAKILLETGPVAQTLSEIATDNHADLLVIGRHHGSGIIGRLRDTAYAIIRESPCPVVSV